MDALEITRKPYYLNMNALTLDANQNGVDPVDWIDRGAVVYFDNLELEVDGKPTPREGMFVEKTLERLSLLIDFSRNIEVSSGPGLPIVAFASSAVELEWFRSSKTTCLM